MGADVELAFRELNAEMFDLGRSADELRRLYRSKRVDRVGWKCRTLPVVALIVALRSFDSAEPFFGRCLVANDYPVWEATRPIAECEYCEGVAAPVRVRPEAFEERLAWGAGPVVVEGGVAHWRAVAELDYETLRRIYERAPNAHDCVDQFLHFRTDLFSPRDVFEMSTARANNELGETPWYVGWTNCDPEVAARTREYYDTPGFLPNDAEFPKYDNIFFGYHEGAVMHLDYIPRIMWQGQIRGNKTWRLAPVPECEHRCKAFEFSVNTGDAVCPFLRHWNSVDGQSSAGSAVKQ